MADDDGMLLNFEIGDAPLKQQVKFTGGRWRDRKRAQRSVNRVREDGDETKVAPTTTDADSDRPAKKQRLDDGASPYRPRQNGGTASRPAAPPGGVASRLFSYNPTPTTDFDRPTETETVIEPSNAPLSEEAENFHALGVSRRIAQHLSSKLELKAPTSIQKNAIPQLITGNDDAFLQAETGSGKTLAYLLPIVHRLMALSAASHGKKGGIHRNSGLFAIVLAPTRELCKQIAMVLEKVLRCAPWLVSTTVIGGESKKSEKARIRKGVNILIATPGRLTDHLDHTKVLDVGTVRWLVLDEGDRLMEMGFEEDIKTIVGKIRQGSLQKATKDGVPFGDMLPTRRVTILCSATMKMNVQRLGDISLQDAVHIMASRKEANDDANATANTTGTDAAAGDALFSAPAQLKQTYLVAPAKLRLVTLVSLLKATFARKGSVMKAIVFISCADSVDFHFDLLRLPETAADTDAESAANPTTKETKGKKGHSSKSAVVTVAPAAYITSPANPRLLLHKLHGSLPQAIRTSTLASFTQSKDPTILITTDIASRGLDVPSVDLVIEYDPAFAVEDHVHRIGRTARAGRPGKAVLFLMPGCEEGYATLLQASSTIAPQLYETVLQKGLASDVDLPANTPNPGQEGGKQTWTSRAENLQLHFEQRLLVKDEIETPAPTNAKHKPVARDSKILDAARQAFRSHIRAYATHTRDERVYFDLTQLHLGHMAKAYGLREAPGGIGGGVQRRSHKPGGAKSGGRKDRDDSDDEHGGANARVGIDEEAAKRMREKMRAVVKNAASEFNIG